MSNGKPGRHKRTGTTIKVRVSDLVLNVYLPDVMRKYQLDRAAAGGIALDAAAQHQLLLNAAPTDPPTS